MIVESGVFIRLNSAFSMLGLELFDVGTIICAAGAIIDLWSRSNGRGFT